MEDRLKELMKELGEAINESLSDSDRIAAAIEEIKLAGYDVFIVLEATIAFNKRDADDDQAEQAGPVEFENSGKVKWTNQDYRFLRTLKIAIDEEK